MKYQGYMIIFMLVFCFSLINTCSIAGVSKSYEFRDIQLGSVITDQMVPHNDFYWRSQPTKWNIGPTGQKKQIQVCERKMEENYIGNIDVSRIEYWYLDSRLMKIVLRINPYYTKDIDELLGMKFGSAYANVDVITEKYWLGKQHVKTCVFENPSLRLHVIERWLTKDSGDLFVEFAEPSLHDEYSRLVAAEEVEKEQRREKSKLDALKDF